MRRYYNDTISEKAFLPKMESKRFSDRLIQFQYLKKEGLQRSHYLLDMGCGWLRAGHLFIRYLEASHYYGIDKETAALDAGCAGMCLLELENKYPQLYLCEGEMDFELPAPPCGYDFAIAQSVFTHMAPEVVEKCLTNVLSVMKPGGKFFATFFEHPEHKLSERHRNRHLEYSRAMYPSEYFSDLAKKIGVSQFEYRGTFGHANNQRMLLFVK